MSYSSELNLHISMIVVLLVCLTDTVNDSSLHTYQVHLISQCVSTTCSTS